MKKFINIMLFCCLAIFLFSCQKDKIEDQLSDPRQKITAENPQGVESKKWNWRHFDKIQKKWEKKHKMFQIKHLEVPNNKKGKSKERLKFAYYESRNFNGSYTFGLYRYYSKSNDIGFHIERISYEQIYKNPWHNKWIKGKKIKKKIIRPRFSINSKFFNIWSEGGNHWSKRKDHRIVIKAKYKNIATGYLWGDRVRFRKNRQMWLTFSDKKHGRLQNVCHNFYFRVTVREYNGRSLGKIIGRKNFKISRLFNSGNCKRLAKKYKFKP